MIVNFFEVYSFKHICSYSKSNIKMVIDSEVLAKITHHLLYLKSNIENDSRNKVKISKIYNIYYID